MKLADNLKYKKDVNKFKEGIALISNQQKKNYFQKIFDNFLAQSQLIDNSHNPSSNSSINPKEIKDNVQELQQLRWQLEQMCKDLNIR